MSDKIVLDEKRRSVVINLGSGDAPSSVRVTVKTDPVEGEYVEVECMQEINVRPRAANMIWVVPSADQPRRSSVRPRYDPRSCPICGDRSTAAGCTGECKTLS